MRNDGYLRTLLHKGTKFARKSACIGLAGFILVGGGSLIAKAATLADVFDAKQYAEDYADLKAAFGDDEAALLNHYLTYGIAEKRQVSGLIDVVEYREKYADLDAAFGDDWDAYVNHFLTYGISEGRDSGTDFNALDYAERYADLKEAFGDDVLALYKHYQEYGKTEQRESRSEKVVVAEREAREAAAAAAASKSRTETWTDDWHNLKVVAEYDSNDRIVKRSEYDIDSGELLYWTDYTYNSIGKCKSIISYYGDGRLRYRTDYTYNSAGDITSIIEKSADGTLMSKYVCEYNSSGEKTKETTTNASGFIYEYVYAGDGSYTYTVIYPNDTYVTKTVEEHASDGSYTRTNFYTDGRKYVQEYDKNNKLLKSANYYANGNPSNVTEGYFDGDDRKPGKTTFHDEDGNVTSVTVCEYDDAGNLLRDKHYDADGKTLLWVNEKNDDGSTKETIYYNPDGTIRQRYANKLDDNGDIIAALNAYPIYNDNGEIEGWVEYWSERDSEGNWHQVEGPLF